MKTRRILLPALFAMLWLPGAALHAQIFVVNSGSNNGNSIGEFNLNGTPVGTGTIATGLDQPYGIAISGTDLFVVNFGNNTLWEYTTAGAQVGPGPLVSSGLSNVTAIAISGSDIFVANAGYAVYEYTTGGSFVESFATNVTNMSGIAVSGTDIWVTGADNGLISEYNTNGQLVTDFLDSNRPAGIAISGSDLFVVNNGNNTVGEYTTAGAPVGSGTLISSGLAFPTGIAISGSDLYVTDGSTGASSNILEYTTTGAPVGTGTLVSTDLHTPFGIAVQQVPAAPKWMLLAMGAGLLFAARRRIRA